MTPSWNDRLKTTAKSLFFIAMIFSSKQTFAVQQPSYPLLNMIDSEAVKLFPNEFLTNNDVSYLIVQKLKNREFRKRFIEFTFDMDIQLIKNAERYYQDKINGKPTSFKNTTRLTGVAFNLIEFGGPGHDFRVYEYLHLPHLAFVSTAFMSEDEFRSFLSSLKGRYAAIDLAIYKLNLTKKKFFTLVPKFTEKMWQSEKVDSSLLKYYAMTSPLWFFRYFRPSKVRLDAIDNVTVEEIKVATTRYLAIIDYLVKQDLVSNLFKQAFVNEMNSSGEIIKDLESRFKIFSDPKVEAISNILYERLASQGFRMNNVLDSHHGPTCGGLFN